MAQSWETLRKDARRLENEIDAKLVTYSKLSSALSTSSSRTSGYDPVRSSEGDGEAVTRRGGGAKDLAAVELMTAEMEGLLARLQRVVDGMGGALSASSGGAPAALSHTLQRHTEILHDYTQEFRKTRGSVSSVRERAELLAGARGDKGKAGSGGSGAEAALHAERAALAGAASGADAAVHTGLSLKEDLERQRAMFASMVERMETMSEGMPAVNRLIGQIRRKKRRDFYILGAIIGVLLFFTFAFRFLFNK